MNITHQVTPERFAQGMPIEQYRKVMSQNREIYNQRYESFQLGEQAAARLQSMGQERTLKVLVLAEDWCGDVLRYLPVFERMAEAARTWDVRVLYRDENPDLADLWLKRGLHRAIPVIVFFDEDLCELSHFIEKPAAVYAADAHGREAFADLHPHLPDAQAHSSQMAPETYRLYADFIQEYRAANVERWQHQFVEEVVGLLEGVECEAA